MTQAIAQFEAARRIAETDLPAALPDLDSESGRRAPAQGGDGQRRSTARPAIAVCCRSAAARRCRRREDFDKAIDYFIEAARHAARRRRGEVAAQRRAHGRRVDIRRACRRAIDPAVGASPRPKTSAASSTCAAKARRRLVLARPAASSSTTSTTTAQLDILTSNFDSCGQMQLFQRGAERHVRRSGRARRARRAARRPQPAADRLQQRRLHRRARAARRLGAAAAQVAAAQQLRRHVHRRHRRQRPGEAGDEHADGGVGRHRQRRLARSVRRQRGRARRSCSATRATARSRTSPRPAGVARTAFTKGVAAGDYDNDGYPDLYVSNLRRRELPLSQQPQPDVHRGGARGRRARSRTAASRPGSSTTTTTAGDDLFVDELLHCRSRRPRARYLRLPHNANDA